MKKFILIFTAIMAVSAFCACGSTDDGEAASEDISTVRHEFLSGVRQIDFLDAASFETALNNDEKVNGKIVQFDVVEYRPDSSLGVNCFAGEHLNFISDSEFDVNAGDSVVGYVKEDPSTVLGSWKVPYVILKVIPAEDLSTDMQDTNEAVDNTTDDAIAEESAEKLTEEFADENTTVEEQKTTETTAAYTTDKVKVRQQPNTDCEVLGVMNAGDEVSVLGTEGDWSHVIAGGNDGYIKSEFLTDVAPTIATVENTQADSTGISTSGAIAAATTTAAVDATTAEATQSSQTVNSSIDTSNATTQGAYMLNTSNGTLHLSNCSHGPEPQNTAYFNTLTDAMNAGAKKSCGYCHPY